MLAYEEILDKSSCLNRALDNEMVFVLLGRDEAAPAAIRAWVKERIRLGKNTPADKQTTEALIAAYKMDEDREYIRGLAKELGKCHKEK